MKIAVFGASGKTGVKAVEQALAMGHEVKALARNPQKITISDEKLSIVQGDVTDTAAVEKTINGVDGVLVTLGASADMQADIVMEQGTKNIIDALKKHNVKRIIVQSSYAMSGDAEGIHFMKQMGMGDEQIAMMQKILDDKKKQTEAVVDSGLEYVLVRPLMLTDGEKTGEYRVGENIEVKPGGNISRADVADFMLKALTDNTYTDKIVTLSY
jgi:putative NADH-flavin reductase